MAEIDRSLPFIDTHHHLWELDRFQYDHELNASPGRLLSGRDVAKADPNVQVILAQEGFSREDQRELLSSNAEKLYRI